jgi:hypothetical protein
MGVQTSVLDSWTDAPARQAVVDFVQRTEAERVPVEERVVVFDNDGLPLARARHHAHGVRTTPIDAIPTPTVVRPGLRSNCGDCRLGQLGALRRRLRRSPVNLQKLLLEGAVINGHRTCPADRFRL